MHLKMQGWIWGFGDFYLSQELTNSGKIPKSKDDFFDFVNTVDIRPILSF